MLILACSIGSHQSSGHSNLQWHALSSQEGLAFSRGNFEISVGHNYDWRMRVGKISSVTLCFPIDVNHSSFYFHSPDDRLMSSSFLRETTTTEDEISKTNITMTTVKTNCATMFQKSTDKIRIAAIQSADENINFIRKFSRSMNVEAIRD